MSDTIKKLLENVIDYAGLFPPANHDLQTAWAKYKQHLGSEYNWMLSHFIIPVQKLEDFSQLLTREEEKLSIDLSVLLSPLAKGEDYLLKLDQELTRIDDFLDKHPEFTIKVDILEQLFPVSVIKTSSFIDINDYIFKIEQVLQKHFENSVQMFLEIKMDDRWTVSAEELIREIDLFNKRKNSRANFQVKNTYGFKIRCGGLNETAYPSVKQVAKAIDLIRIFHVPLKATAGLHHPIRHYNEKAKVKMHGFLNLIAATIFANLYKLNKSQTEEILDDTNSQSFQFKDCCLKWNDYQVNLNQISTLRKSTFISFGSCSFNEPIDDLKKLNLL